MNNEPGPQPSPLTLADPSSINELFAREPDTWDEFEIAKAVAELRAQRTKWNATEVAKKSKPSSANVDVSDLLKGL